MVHQLRWACVAAVAGVLPCPAGAQPIELPAPGATAGPGDMASSDIRSSISAAASMPPSLREASVKTFLQAARRALAARRMGEAQEALERAETRLLQSSAGLPHTSSSDGEHTLRDIAAARSAAAARDRQGALRAIDDALTPVTRPASAPDPGWLPVAPVPSAPAQAMYTSAVLPGRWQLEGARYVWIPSVTSPFLTLTQPRKIVPNARQKGKACSVASAASSSAL
jgi:hypothetical protein